MKLTHKAIARMAGYRVRVVKNSNLGYPQRLLPSKYDWISVIGYEEEISNNLYDTEQEAWKACCIENGLIEEE